MEPQSLHTEQTIAYCGLYCGNCSKYKKGKCSGCAQNEKLTWCKIRSCCQEKQLAHCGMCDEYQNPMDCSKYNSMIGRIIGFLTGTDRSQCILFLREYSNEEYIAMMKETGKMSMPKRR